ncbi:hypothetical protein, partial [Sinorhizobium meliloti]|uniref:hypothetical protein n=1 Tax=Rhizobium meliloti TaxID=382 RepID=UPI001AECC408
PVKKRDALPQPHEGHGEHARRRRLPRSARSFKEGKGGFGKADYAKTDFGKGRGGKSKRKP